MSEFSGKVVMVTGGGSGIGRGTALLFGQEKAKVVVVDWNEPSALETAKIVQHNGGEALAIKANVASENDVKGVVEAALNQYGRIDVLFANAATQITKSVEDTTEKEWDLIHAVNLKGVFLCCKYVIPVMRKQGSGSIVIACSGHAFSTYPNCSAYAATKGGLLAFMRGAALDCAPAGIRVNCVLPGATDTPLLRNYLRECADPAGEETRIMNTIPLKRLAQPEDIARAVRFLASSNASYITGTWLAVDGGLLAQG
ncbi:MAG TPA: glucose 1-dehydrogenase [Terriglobia bacterium]|nr:glucose 1-dehydrogenase [Terriglobia bacterium]